MGNSASVAIEIFTVILYILAENNPLMENLASTVGIEKDTFKTLLINNKNLIAAAVVQLFKPLVAKLFK
jgi:hypothetical protein